VKYVNFNKGLKYYSTTGYTWSNTCFTNTTKPQLNWMWSLTYITTIYLW